MKTLSVEIDADGLALVTFDVPGRSMNTIGAQVIADFETLLRTVADDAAIRGIVLVSGKSSGFCAGADLDEMERRLGPPPAGSGDARLRADYEATSEFSRLLRRLETCGKPIAAALTGLALGGGLELALAAHYRVVADDPRIKLGLPESTIGLLPGAGGTQRLPRLIGIMPAMPLLLEGKSVSPQQALTLGFVDACVAAADVVETAKAWIGNGAEAVQPWGRPGFKMPGGTVYSPAVAPLFSFANGAAIDRTYGNYPALLNIMRCLYEGTQVPIDAALRIESRYFVRTMHTPQAKAMVRSLFLSMQELAKGGARPKGPARFVLHKVGVLGAGMMGAGIAHAQAVAGIDTVLIDRDGATAEAGKGYARKLLERDVATGRGDRAKADAILARIATTEDYTRLAGADMVVEAVFEDRAVKREAFRLAEALIGPDAVLASNTSTLPITGLAEYAARPANVVGIHFFSPVDRMKLVEIIRGRVTSDETIAKAVDYVLALRKTPIVVNDGRGFYTSRVFAAYLDEGLALLAEGVPPAAIDMIGRMTGMPRGPLELSDDVAIDLLDRARKQARADLGADYLENPGDAIVARMVASGRLGRKGGGGFYDYPAAGAKKLWPGLSEFAELRPLRDGDTDRIRRRLLYRQAIEAARCFAEGVVTDPREADVGAILGWGFAPWTGGPISLIDGIGAADFVAECDALAAEHGPRFTPPAMLREMAAAGRGFYDAGEASARAA